MEKEIQIKYGTDRRSRVMVIRKINDLETNFSTKLMACKLFRKFCKEETHAGVIATTVQ